MLLNFLSLLRNGMWLSVKIYTTFPVSDFDSSSWGWSGGEWCFCPRARYTRIPSAWNREENTTNNVHDVSGPLDHVFQVENGLESSENKPILAKSWKGDRETKWLPTVNLPTCLRSERSSGWWPRERARDNAPLSTATIKLKNCWIKFAFAKTYR